MLDKVVEVHFPLFILLIYVPYKINKETLKSGEKKADQQRTLELEEMTQW